MKKIFKVTIDNNPGGWKQGEDPSILVIAESEIEAISLVKTGWGIKHDDDYQVEIYSYQKGASYYPYITQNAQYHVIEIIFEDYEIAIGKKDIRKKKLIKLNKNESL